MRRIDIWVVDSSVAGKWYLADEDLTDNARSIWTRYSRSDVQCVAPYFSRHEVASLLTKASLAGRITWDRAQEELSNYISAGISHSEDPDWLLKEAIGFCRRFPVSLYDALYLALADAIGAQLVTADRRMQNGLAGRIPFLTWLGDIPT